MKEVSDESYFACVVPHHLLTCDLWFDCQLVQCALPRVDVTAVRLEYLNRAKTDGLIAGFTRTGSNANGDLFTVQKLSLDEV
jgi:hypothetical protein